MRQSGRQSSRGIRSGGSSGQMNAARGSGRGSARGSARQSARQSARGSARSSARGRGVEREPEPPPPPGRRSAKRGGGGTELLICVVIIVVLGIVCGFLYVKKNRDKKEEAQRRAQATRAEEENNDRAFMAFMKAESAGHDFATGKVREISDDVLFGPFRGDEKVYNVIYCFTYKKKNQNHPDQKAMHDDNTHLNIQQYSKGTVREGVSITHGLTSDDQPIMIARKFYPPPADDKSNLGGEIMVIVKAVK